MLAVQFRPEHVDEYKRLRRLGEGGREKVRIVRDLVGGKAIRREVKVKVPVGDTTIRRELEVLSAAFNNARRRGVLRFVPFIEKPVVDNVRRQEIPLEQFPAVLAAMTSGRRHDGAARTRDSDPRVRSSTSRRRARPVSQTGLFSARRLQSTLSSWRTSLRGKDVLGAGILVALSLGAGGYLLIRARSGRKGLAVCRGFQRNREPGRFLGRSPERVP